MTYLTFKIFHLIALITWIGSMIFTPVLLAILSALGGHTRERSAAEVARWFHRITTPAMALTWGFGLALLTTGGWITSRWMLVKLLLVVGLSALHGVFSGRLRRLAREAKESADAASSASFPAAMFVMAQLIVVGVIVSLVVLKPF